MKRANFAPDLMYWFPRMFATILIFFFLSVILFSFFGQEINLTKLETELISNHLIYDCLVLEKGGNKQIGVIDKEKFTQHIISECIRRDNLGYKVTLGEKELFVMEKQFKDYFDVCKSIKSFECEKKEHLVLVENKLTKLTVEVIKNKE